ncbi:SNF2-related protein [Caulobacter sp. KR2-114]|uniref:SNF2-related protein n=1 Tax=Caulobacter sp. KR2-114 TaxID=3400912 RepID=UPI003C05E45B
MIEADMRVRVKDDPAKVGIASAQTRITNGRVYRQVQLASGQPIWLLESRLIPLEEAPDAVSDLARGQLSAPDDLGRLLTHVRLTGRLADLIYSMEATNTDFHAFQFKPVVKILNSASRGLLIADEVGLGKTIEAGLVWTELAARYDVRRLLVVCPKSLQPKWRTELRDKFRVFAEASDAAELLSTLKEAEVRGGDFAVVATLSGVRLPRGWDDQETPASGARAELARFLDARQGGEPLFDMVVFDEAHHLRNSETAQHRTARMITELADYKLMLSATPINLRSEDLRSILRLIEPDLFDREWIFSELQTENAPLVEARDKVLSARHSLADVAEALTAIAPGQLLKTDRRLAILREQLSEDATTDTPARRAEIASRLEEMSMLGGIVNRTRRRDVSDMQVVRRAECRRWQMNELERDFYDRASAIIRQYAWEADVNEMFLLSNTQRMLASCLPAAYRRWKEAVDDFGEEGEDEVDRPARRAAGPLIQALSAACEDPRGAGKLADADSKYTLLRTALGDTWAADPLSKLIVFSSYRGTLDYLEERLQADGIACHKMHGSISRSRESVLEAFEDAPGAAVLLTSEIGGEGLDMQFCRILINYDLPWNPMRVEQRVGRIDRIGQTAETVEVFSLICEGTIEDRVYTRLYERLELIVRTLGGFEPILGPIVRELEGRLLDPKLTTEEVNGEIERAAQAAETRRRIEDDLEEEAAGLIAHGDMILRRIKRTHEQQRWIQPEELYSYLRGGLQAIFPRSSIDRAPVDYEAHDLRLCPAAHQAFREYLDNRARRFETRLRRGEPVRVAFKKPAGARRPDIEVITPTHPLVRFIAEQREAAASGLNARPAVVGLLDADERPAGLQPGTYGLAVQRWSVGGVTPQDRLVYAGMDLVTGELLAEETAETLTSTALQHLQMMDCSPSEAARFADAIRDGLIEGHLERAHSEYIAIEEASHEDKRATLLAVLQRQLDSRRAKDEAQIAELLRVGGRRARIVPAQRAKLEKYVGRMELKIEEAERAGYFEFNPPETLGVAVVEVA